MPMPMPVYLVLGQLVGHANLAFTMLGAGEDCPVTCVEAVVRRTLVRAIGTGGRGHRF